MRSPSFLDINEAKVKFFFSDKILCQDLFVTEDRFLVSSALEKELFVGLNSSEWNTTSQYTVL
jgi:hypothetical protein